MTKNSEPVDLGEDIRRTLRNLIICTICLYIALAIVVIIGFLDARDRRHSITKHTNEIGIALDELYNADCTLRNDLERRIDSSKQFLLENPKGIPGISAKVIKKDIIGQQRTLRILKTLDCTPAGPNPERNTTTGG